MHKPSSDLNKVVDFENVWIVLVTILTLRPHKLTASQKEDFKLGTRAWLSRNFPACVPVRLGEA